MLELTNDELLTTTRSVRKRLDLERPVPRPIIEECLGLALQAPNGSNQQPWRWIAIDDPEIRTDSEAAAALGGRMKDWQAGKLLAQARRLGTDGIREAYGLVAQADLDLKGARAIPEDAVMEVLVARLAALSARSGARPRAARGGRRR